MQLMKKKLNKYTTSIPPVYHQYTTSIPSVYHQYDTSIPPVHHQYTMVYVYHGIQPVYHQYTTKAFTGLDQGFCFHMVVQWNFFNFSLKIALHCIALHCSVWSAFQFKADSTEIYESSMNLFLLVFSLKCISIKTRQQWDLREFCFCFSACNAFQFVTTVCTS